MPLNNEVSDGGGHQMPKPANEQRPPPFAPPKSQAGCNASYARDEQCEDMDK
jgi:hypothetical protein